MKLLPSTRDEVYQAERLAQSVAAIATGVSIIAAIVLLFVTGIMNIVASTHAEAVYSNLDYVASVARAHDRVNLSGQRVQLYGVGRWQPAVQIAATASSYLNSPSRINDGDATYPVYAAKGATVAKMPAESVEVDSAASSPRLLVLRSRSKTGAEYELTSTANGATKTVQVKPGHYYWQSEPSSLGLEVGGLAGVCALLWLLAKRGGRLLRRRLQKVEGKAALVKWRKHTTGLGRPDPVEGFVVLVPRKQVHSNDRTGEVQVEFVVSRLIWQKDRWREAGGRRGELEGIWQGKTHWSAETPMPELVDAWISFLTAVSEANERLNPSAKDAGEIEGPDIQELLRQRLQTVALLETPEEMAAKQPAKRTLLALKRR